jgi:hypothetical protein
LSASEEEEVDHIYSDAETIETGSEKEHDGGCRKAVFWKTLDLMTLQLLVLHSVQESLVLKREI